MLLRKGRLVDLPLLLFPLFTNIKPYKPAMENKSLASAALLAVAMFAVASCSQSSREEAIERVSDAAKTLNGKSDTTPDVVKAQQKKDRERQNTQWTDENITLHPIEACTAKLDEIEANEQRALVFYNKELTMKLAAERAQRAADADAKKFADFLALAKPIWTNTVATGNWPASVNGYPLSQEELRAKMTEALRKKAMAETKSLNEAKIAQQAEQAMRQVQDARKKLATERERVLEIKRKVELGAFQNDLDAFSKALNGGVPIDGLEAVGQTIGADITPDVFTPSKASEDTALLDSFLAE